MVSFKKSLILWLVIVSQPSLGLVVTRPCCHEYEHRGSLFGSKLPEAINEKAFYFHKDDRMQAGTIEGELKLHMIRSNEACHVSDTMCQFSDKRAKDFEDLTDAIVLIPRGDCDFAEKVYEAQLEGAKAAIIFQNELAGPLDKDDEIVMSADAKWRNSVTIPAAFVSYNTGQELIELLGGLKDLTNTYQIARPHVHVVLNQTSSVPITPSTYQLPEITYAMIIVKMVFLAFYVFLVLKMVDFVKSMCTNGKGKRIDFT
mmetsp:Transcript_21128/g.25589  ORF Transcript_21128/g.25589 Transcript_21128/m.25589 type:complete len:258 (-) Transcript_21128:66-839(-)